MKVNKKYTRKQTHLHTKEKKTHTHTKRRTHLITEKNTKHAETEQGHSRNIARKGKENKKQHANNTTLTQHNGTKKQQAVT